MTDTLDNARSNDAILNSRRFADPDDCLPTDDPERCDLTWFIEIVNLVNSHTVEEELIAAVLTKLEQFEVAAEVVVRRLSPDQKRLIPFAADPGDGLRAILRSEEVPATGSYEGHALSTGRLVVANESEFPSIRLEKEYIPLVKLVRDAGVATGYFYPMTAHKQIGTVTFYGFDDYPLDEERQELARRTVRVLASGIEKCRLLAAAADRRAELDAATAQLESSNRDLRDFAYVASHDLQEPLRKIQTFGDRLESRAADRLTDEQRTHLDRMTSASQKMQALINDLLRFSRATGDSGQKQLCELGDLVRTAIDAQRKEHGLADLDIETADLPSAEVNGQQFLSVFETLVENAWTYRSPDRDSTLSISATVSEPDESDGSISLRFTDNGIGFDAKYAQRVFQPFFRLHDHSEYEGSGIGLAICDRVVTNHGGSIVAESQVDIGTTITLTIPINRTLDPNGGSQ